MDATKIASMGLSAQDVARSVHSTDAKVPSGLLRSEDAGTLVIEIEGELNSLDHIRRTPLRSGDLGQFVTIRDVATVKKGVREPASELAFVDEQPAVTVGVFLDEGIRGDRWAEQAREAVKHFEKQLPRGISAHLIFDQSKYTNERLSDLGRNLLIGAMAVMLVVFVMMGWRSAVIVGTALPLTALMVLSGMWVIGLSINQFSVAGLIIALGLLIDNAIVFVDEMRQRLREASSASEAIRQSVQHLAIPLIGSTLTTILAFLPIALMPGNRGEFAGGLAYGVTLALVSSLLLSMTVIPAFAAMLSRPSAGGESASRSRPGRWWREGLAIPAVTQKYGRLLGFLFRRPLLGMTLAAVLPIAGFISATQLTEQFFPPSGRDMFHIEVQLLKHASAAQTRTITARISERLSNRDRVKNVHWFHGENAPSFYYNLIRNQDEATYYAQAIVQLDSADGVFELINSVQAELDEAFPEARILARQLEQGPPFAAPVEMRIFGPDLDRLEELGDDIRRILSDTPDVVHTWDGRWLAYASDRAGPNRDVYVQAMDEAQPAVQPLRVTSSSADEYEPALSPDGLHLAYRSEQSGGGVYLMSRTTTGGWTAPRLLAPLGRRPRFSPNGQWMAYWVGKEAGHFFTDMSGYIVRWGEETPRPIQLQPHFRGASMPIWSPDGYHVLFAGIGSVSATAPASEMEFDLWIAPVEGGPPIKTEAETVLERHAVGDLRFLKLGSWIATPPAILFSAPIGESTELFLLPLDPATLTATGHLQRLTTTTGMNTQPWACANAADQRIVFAAGSQNVDIWALPIDANSGKTDDALARLTTDLAGDHRPDLSLDGSTLVFDSRRNASRDIWHFDLLTHTEHRLIAGPANKFGALANMDGSRVLYRVDSNVYLREPDGTTTCLATDCGDIWDWSRDERYVSYTRYRESVEGHELYVLDITSGVKAKLLQDPTRRFYQAHFDRTGNWITFLAVYSGSSQVYVMAFDPGDVLSQDEWIPITDGRYDDDKPRWSPDGTLVYFTSERDGFRCLWAQKVDPESKRPDGDPFVVYHFHEARLSMLTVGLADLEISVAVDKIAFCLNETKSNIFATTLKRSQ